MSGRTWTNHEERDLISLIDLGFENKVIAKRLDRSANAVQLQSARLGMRRRDLHLVITRDRPRSSFPSIVITKAELPRYYTRGWRVAWFEGNRVGVEWRSNREPRWLP